VVDSPVKNIVSGCLGRAFLLKVERGRGRSGWTTCVVFHMLPRGAILRRAGWTQGLLNSQPGISVLNHWKLPLCLFSFFFFFLFVVANGLQNNAENA